MRGRDSLSYRGSSASSVISCRTSSELRPYIRPHEGELIEASTTCQPGWRGPAADAGPAASSRWSGSALRPTSKGDVYTSSKITNSQRAEDPYATPDLACSKTVPPCARGISLGLPSPSVGRKKEHTLPGTIAVNRGDLLIHQPPARRRRTRTMIQQHQSTDRPGNDRPDQTPAGRVRPPAMPRTHPRDDAVLAAPGVGACRHRGRKTVMSYGSEEDEKEQNSPHPSVRAYRSQPEQTQCWR